MTRPGTAVARQRHLYSALLEREERWHYEGGRRDLRLDLLRGFAVFAMIVDHVGGKHSWLYPLTGGNQFFVSAGEAFVFISGAVLGIVYLNVAMREGIAAAMQKALHRAWTLYLLTVLLTLTFAGLGYVLNVWWRPDFAAAGGVGLYVVDVVTLHRTLFLTDIPLMYTLLLVGAVPVLFLLSRGQTALVLAGSWLLWTLWQLGPHSSLEPWRIEGNIAFNLPAWQVLFVSGIVIGWHRTRLESWIAHLSRPIVFTSLALVAVAVVALYVVQMTQLASLQNSATLSALAFEKANEPVVRLLVFALLAVFAFTLTTLFWDPIKRTTSWLLLPLGQNALTAYSVHIFIVALTTRLSVYTLQSSLRDNMTIVGAQVAAILAIWAIVVLEPRLKRWLTQIRLPAPRSAVAAPAPAASDAAGLEFAVVWRPGP